MPLPADVPTFTLVADFPPLSTDGTERTGELKFTPIPGTLPSPDAVYLGVENATLDASGGMSKTLIACDAFADAFVWRVDGNIDGQPPFSVNISVPASAGTVNLGAVAEFETLPPDYVVVPGPRGPEGPTGSGGGGAGTPSSTVVPSTSFGQSSAPGSATTYSRGDHVHGTPATPTKATVGLGSVDNTSDAAKPVSAATSTALAAKADLVGGTVPTAQLPTPSAQGALTKASNLSDLPSAPSARTNLGLGTAAVAAASAFDAAGAAATAQSGAASYTDGKITAEVTRANAAYDTAGAATTVAGNLTTHTAATTTVHGIADTSALVTTADSRLTNSRAPSGAAGGDLSGTFPNPSVAKVNGVAVSGTAASGKVLTASSSSAATWQDPAGGGGGSAGISSDGRINEEIVVLAAAAGWTIVTTSLGVEIGVTVAASVGNRIWFSPSFLRTGGVVFLDIGIKAAAGGVSRYISSGTSTPRDEGYAPLYPLVTFTGVVGIREFIVQEGEVDGDGNVKIVLAYKGAADGNQKLYFGSGYDGAIWSNNPDA